MMRQIDEVIATQDGTHALALCTDGGVLYYRADIPAQTEDDAKRGTVVSEYCNVSRGSLVELGKISRDIDPATGGVVDGSWNLRRIGSRGHVVLMRASREVDEGELNSLHINILSGMIVLTLCDGSLINVA